MPDVSSGPTVAPNPAYKQEIIKIPGTMLYIRIDTGPDLEEAQLCFDDGDADTYALAKFWGLKNARVYEAIMEESRRSPSPAGVTEAAVEAALAEWSGVAWKSIRDHIEKRELTDPATAMRAALLAAIPLLSPSMGWETIDTAPRDGTAVLLYAGAWSMSWGEVQTGHFEGDGEGGGTWVTGEGSVDDNEADFDPDAEVDEDGGDAGFDADVNIGPTHWQRLPLPPANGEGR